ncbi:hypothetical protein MRX96_042072 [Rhipicephalus microplus]
MQVRRSQVRVYHTVQVCHWRMPLVTGARNRSWRCGSIWCMSHGSFQEALNTRHRSPGVVACLCNPASWRLVLVDVLRLGALPHVDLCRSGVRAKLGVDMVTPGEPGGDQVA